MGAMTLKLHSTEKLVIVETDHGDMWVGDGNLPTVIRLKTGNSVTNSDGHVYEVLDYKEFTKMAVKSLFGVV